MAKEEPPRAASCTSGWHWRPHPNLPSCPRCGEGGLRLRVSTRTDRKEYGPAPKKETGEALESEEALESKFLAALERAEGVLSAHTKQWVVLWVDAGRVQMEAYLDQNNAEAHLRRLMEKGCDSARVIVGYGIKSYAWKMGLQED